jgi:murein DD-endopeptidase MepM/ murein hydrolase activator NlpD
LLCTVAAFAAFAVLGAAAPVAASTAAAAPAPVAELGAARAPDDSATDDSAPLARAPDDSAADGSAPLARAPDDSAADGRFSWPLQPEPQVVRSFQAPDDPYGPGHRGVDLAAQPGQPVLAAGAGVVVFAGELAGRGVVSIDHDALRTTYEPVRPAVKVGDQVYAGQRIATVASGHGGCDGPCLHWGVRRGNPPEYLNPLELLGSSRIRLKPWEGDA